MPGHETRLKRWGGKKNVATLVSWGCTVSQGPMVVVNGKGGRSYSGRVGRRLNETHIASVRHHSYPHHLYFATKIGQTISGEVSFNAIFFGLVLGLMARGALLPFQSGCVRQTAHSTLLLSPLQSTSSSAYRSTVLSVEQP